MWPWDHLALGYLAYAVLTRATRLERPTAATAAAVAVGTQFPDLVDKPLGWWLGVFATGTGLAHSLLVALPVCLVVVAAGWRLDRTGPAVAFSVGYLTHLPGDVLYPLLFRGEPKLWFLLWPLRSAPGSGASTALPHLADLVADFLAFLATPRGLGYLAAELLVLSLAVWVWVRDGCPGLGWLPSGA